MKMKRNKGYFSISAVAKMFSIHQQTIRLYEKEGLISPKRSEGNTRLFTEEDVDKLEEIIYLTHELGINLAGVEMIFKLKKQISKMQKDMNKMFEDTNKELDMQVEASKEAVKASAQKLLHLKKEAPNAPPTGLLIEQKIPKPAGAKQQASEQQTIDLGNWDIEYEEE